VTVDEEVRLGTSLDDLVMITMVDTPMYGQGTEIEYFNDIFDGIFWFLLIFRVYFVVSNALSVILMLLFF
jgi:hypothetical protein